MIRGARDATEQRVALGERCCQLDPLDGERCVERAGVMGPSVAHGLVALALLLSLSCGYLQGGVWEDDDGNWQRAFGSERPATYVVPHSKYWRSTHWSYEFRYLFQVKANAIFRHELFARNKLRQLPSAGVADAIRNPFGDSPSWFCPKGAGSYDAWAYQDEPNSNFRVLIDKESGDIFLRDYQV